MTGATLPGAVLAQDYPNKPIRVITAEPGGGIDVSARLITQGLSARLGQQVIVENRGGAGGVIPISIVAKALPDGYTLLFYSNTVWVLPLMKKVNFDPARDFAPISLVSRTPSALVVHPSLPLNSVRELIAAAEAKPGTLNYATSGLGSATHLAAALFATMAGVNIVRVDYKGAAHALSDVIGGHVHLMFANAGGVAPHVKSGRLRALGVTSPEPSALLSGVPTVAATLPGYESSNKYGVFAPAKTPETIVNRLNQEIVRVLNRADVKEQFLNSGAEVVGSSPQHFAATMNSETARIGKVIKDAGLRPE